MRTRIDVLCHQLVQIYRDAAEERSRLHQQEWESDEKAYSVLATASEVGDAIQGYARSISRQAMVQKPDRLLRGILRLGPFQHAEMMGWRLDHQRDYPHLCQYLEGLDHLRLLLIVFLIQQSKARRSVRHAVERGLVPLERGRAARPRFTSL